MANEKTCKDCKWSKPHTLEGIVKCTKDNRDAIDTMAENCEDFESKEEATQ